MPDTPTKSAQRVLEPIDRISEVLFGLIMVLTFTGSLSVAGAERAEVRTMLIGALGCNTVWGIIDGVLYLMGSLAERGRSLRILHAVRNATAPQNAWHQIAEALPPVVAGVLQPSELEAIHLRLKQLPESPEHVYLRKEDWLGAVGVFLLVFLSMFPVVIPFLFLHDASLALRFSNGIAIGMLFVAGFAYGKVVGRHPWLMGLSMVVLGSVLVAITIALGG